MCGRPPSHAIWLTPIASIASRSRAPLAAEPAGSSITVQIRRRCVRPVGRRPVTERSEARRRPGFHRTAWDRRIGADCDQEASHASANQNTLLWALALDEILNTQE